MKIKKCGLITQRSSIRVRTYRKRDVQMFAYHEPFGLQNCRFFLNIVLHKIFERMISKKEDDWRLCYFVR